MTDPSAARSDLDLRGRVVVITGAGRGIGRAVASLLSSEGARLMISDSGGDAEGRGLDPSVIEATGRALTVAPGATVITDCRDLSERGASEALIERARTELGPIDGIVTCAGAHIDAPVWRTDEDTLDRMLAIAVKHPLAMLRAASSEWIADKRGALVALAGPGAFVGARGGAAVSAGHGALVSAMRAAALELRKHDVRVNVVIGSARTRLTESLPLYQSIEPSSLSPEHIAPTIAYLLTAAATDLSGEVIGAAGPRSYAYRVRETPGGFGDAGAPASIASAGARVREGLRT